MAKAVKSLEIPAFLKLIFQDSFCVISFLDAQDSENPVISMVTGFLLPFDPYFDPLRAVKPWTHKALTALYGIEVAVICR